MYIVYRILASVLACRFSGSSLSSLPLRRLWMLAPLLDSILGCRLSRPFFPREAYGALGAGRPSPASFAAYQGSPPSHAGL